MKFRQRQSSGNTGIFSFRLKDARYVEPILRHIQLIAFAESLGGVESLMTYPLFRLMRIFRRKSAVPSGWMIVCFVSLSASSMRMI